MATSVTIPGLGVLILGGFKELTSSLLMTGSTEWVAGPDLTGTNETTSYYGSCSVLLSDTKLLLIGSQAEGLLGGTRVQEYDVTTQLWTEWPSLVLSR